MQQENRENATGIQAEARDNSTIYVAKTINIYESSRPSRGIPFQALALPKDYVDRPEIRQLVKSKLIDLSLSRPGTLVVSAIYGLGGVGKSVIASTLAHDAEVQGVCSDGVLWATLGQNPDILPFLYGWIQALGDYDYKPTSTESASSHLRSLLYDKKILLVVDDVWKTEHVEPFQVGGVGCRVLVTTREAHVPDAERIDMDVMSSAEALELLLSKAQVKGLTTHEEGQARKLIEIVGRLPLAVDLAGAQISDGMSWDELLEDLEAEIAYLESLDRPNSEGVKDEKTRKRLSLKASLNLSLKLLTEEQLRQFAWLGVLPEDVSIQPDMAATLWSVPRRQAGVVLRTFRAKSLLLSGVQGISQGLNYRLHDLMHDLARGVLTSEGEKDIPGLNIEFKSAHAMLLDRYRQQAKEGQWHTLPNDGYIHSHLTWHFKKAGQSDELHKLLQEETPEGRNGWYEACDRLGQFATFITDVTRAWKLAELIHLENVSQSLALQCRYALVISSLNSIVRNIPINLFETLIKSDYWTPEQSLSQALQIREPSNKANAIAAILPYLPEKLLSVVHDNTMQIKSHIAKAKILCALSRRDLQILSEAYQMTLCLQECWEKAQLLIDLAFLDKSLLSSALEVIRKMPLIGGRAYLLSKTIPLDSRIQSEVIQIINEELPKTNEIALKDQKMRVMHELASQDSRWLSKALHAILDNTNDQFAGIFLARLPKIDIELLPFVRQELRKIKDIRNRAECLSELSSVDINLFSEAYQTTLSIELESERKNALSLLAQYNHQLRGAALKASQLTNDNFYLAEVISQIAKFSEHYFEKALDIALSIEYECSRSNTLGRLTQILPLPLLPQVLEAIEHIESPTERARVFTEIAKRDEKFFHEALDAVRNAQDDYWKTSFLISLSEKHDWLVPEALFALRNLIYDGHRGHLLHDLILQLPKSILNQAFEATQFVESMSLRARNLCTLAIRESSFLPEALNVVRKIQGDIDKARCLRQLSSHYKQFLPEALQATLDIHEENHRVNELIELICLDSDWFPKALEAAQRIKDPLARVQNLIKLAEINEVALPDAVEAVAYIQDEYQQALKMNSIAQKFPNLFLSKAIETTRNLQDPYCRAQSFSDLIPQILNMIDFDLWKELLHNIANLERRNLLDNIPKLRLAIVSLGGTEALDESIKAMQDVTKWWP